MKNIALSRIDDRLIHGQVVTSWIKQTGGNRIIIVDDGLVKDLFMQKVFKAAAPPGIKVEVYDQEKAAEILKGDEENGEKIVILAKTPQVFEKLIEGGVNIKKIVLGGMGAMAGRKKFNRNVSASQEETESMKRMIGQGIEIVFQLVPTESPADVRKMLEA